MKNRQWRKKPNDEIIRLMEESVDLKLYLVQEKGPLSLTFKDDYGDKYHISIGEEISCTCGGGKTEHCVHTLFTLNRIFKIPFNNPLILQLHFTDSELNKLLEAKNRKQTQSHSASQHKKQKHISMPSSQNTNQMNLLDDTVCPICQEDLYTNEGIFYCKESCGHNFHVGCLKVYIKHKTESDGLVKCPMCRAKWQDELYNKVISSVISVKCVKPHKGVNCSSCNRMNIKFERFHCVICENYNICVECFAQGVHKDKEHKFIMQKTPEDKWIGVEYKDLFDGEHRYMTKNTYLGQFLADCLEDYKHCSSSNNNGYIEGLDNPSDDNNNSNNILTIQNTAHVNNNVKCAICKTVTRQPHTSSHSKALNQITLLKQLPLCKHAVHIRCCDKAFKILNYDVHNKSLVVDKQFNKCRIDNQPIFKGLITIKTSHPVQQPQQSHQSEYPSLGGGINGIYSMNINNNHPNQIRPIKNKSLSKREIIHNMLMEANREANDPYYGGFGLNIQKVNFDHDNDIQRFESNYHNRKMYNDKVRNKGIPYNKIQRGVQKKQSMPLPRNEVIVAKNINEKKETKSKTQASQDDKRPPSQIGAVGSLIVTKMPTMNMRPARYESDVKMMLSPLLIDLPE